MVNAISTFVSRLITRLCERSLASYPYFSTFILVLSIDRFAKYSLILFLGLPLLAATRYLTTLPNQPLYMLLAMVVIDAIFGRFLEATNVHWGVYEDLLQRVAGRPPGTPANLQFDDKQQGPRIRGDLSRWEKSLERLRESFGHTTFDPGTASEALTAILMTALALLLFFFVLLFLPDFASDRSWQELIGWAFLTLVGLVVVLVVLVGIPMSWLVRKWLAK